MTHIRITRGLNIPIKGKPEGPVLSKLMKPKNISLNLNGFEEIKFRLLTHEGDIVKIGQPLAEDKSAPGSFFVAPAAGVVKEIRRGLKRRLLDIIIEVAPHEEYLEYTTLDPLKVSQEELIARLMEGGLFTRIHVRPFNYLANPNHLPRTIFVKGLESAPFIPSAEIQVAGHEKDFQTGLNALTKLTDGLVHLVYYKDTTCSAFSEAQNVQKHTAEGPHPIANYSLHIQKIDPIQNSSDLIWTVNAHDVVSIGHFLNKGKTFIDRVISISGPGILEDKIGYYKAREGYSISALAEGRIQNELVRLISGDPLMGNKVHVEEFLGYDDYVFCGIPENMGRQFLHFMRLGDDKYSFSKAYLSGHFNNAKREYDFTTNQHGETRPFIDNTLYDEVMPLNVPTMHLVKAVMAEDYDQAESYGLLEVDPEDFALPTFVDPSKIEMVDIIKQGLRQHAKEVLH